MTIRPFGERPEEGSTGRRSRLFAARSHGKPPVHGVVGGGGGGGRPRGGGGGGRRARRGPRPRPTPATPTKRTKQHNHP
ncbi:hypothetical protein, partial [Nocardia abscessus]|uniref:hypothetical protein n=1 Tax=Nocardia abscessus TaxID=120957 RepID=UPI002453825D